MVHLQIPLFRSSWSVPVDDKAALLTGYPSYNWYEARSTRWHGSAWDHYDHLFFMADGYLYGVKGGEFFKYPVTGRVEELARIGTAGWSDFKFLIAPLGANEGQSSWHQWGALKNTTLSNRRIIPGHLRLRWRQYNQD